MNDCRKQSGITCSFVVFMALNVAMLVVGINATGHCPEEPMVPVYLIGSHQGTDYKKTPQKMSDFPVAGSTSLSLLLVRVLISHLLLPYLEGKRAEAEEAEAEAEATGSLATWILASLTVYDSMASIFSTVRQEKNDINLSNCTVRTLIVIFVSFARIRSG